MIALLSHALQPLNVSCFKPFKTTFRKVKDVAMSGSNHMNQQITQVQQQTSLHA
jgi:hypothetical protein